MPSIRETIAAKADELRISPYTIQQAEPIIVALEEREIGITEAISDVCQDEDLDMDWVRRTLAETGLMSRPQPIANVGSNGEVDGDLGARLAKLEEAVTSLAAIAERAQRRGLI